MEKNKNPKKLFLFRRKWLKTPLFAIAGLLFLVAQASCQNQRQDQTHQAISALTDSIKEEFAPDSRVAIFDMQTDTTAQGKLFVRGESNLPEAINVFRKKINQKFPGIELQIGALPEKTLGDSTYGIVRVSVASIRSQPRHSAELATQALMGTPLKIYKARPPWLLVQTPDRYIGWAYSPGFVQTNPEGMTAWKNAEKLIFTAQQGFCYTEPFGESQIVSDLVLGNIFQKKGENGNFYHILLPDGREAFVSKNLTMPYKQWLRSLSPTPENIISTAHKFMGTPYLWGGTSPKLIDCSGFTKSVFFMHGIVLQRDASQQTLCGKLIDTREGWHDLQPADLVFFGRHATDSTAERVTHVGIYIGNSEFIHASGRVKINSFDPSHPNFSAYLRKRLIRGRRVLNSVGTPGIEHILQSPWYNLEMK